MEGRQGEICDKQISKTLNLSRVKSAVVMKRMEQEGGRSRGVDYGHRRSHWEVRSKLALGRWGQHGAGEGQQVNSPWAELALALRGGGHVCAQLTQGLPV